MTTPTRSSTTANAAASTREQLVSHAQTLIRQRGYNGFSYRDLAEQIGVKTASIHYHFPSKDDLLLAAVEDYTHKSAAVLQMLNEVENAVDRLDRFALRLVNAPSGQICMCGMLSADLASLSDRVRDALQSFYRLNERWLAKVVADGVKDGSLKSSGDAESDGRWLFAAFQGALMGSRLFQNTDRIVDVVDAVRVTPRREAGVRLH
jgi:TetR/AcrR family transcriptional repressor of nem operon